MKCWLKVQSSVRDLIEKGELSSLYPLLNYTTAAALQNTTSIQPPRTPDPLLSPANLPRLAQGYDTNT